MPLPNSVDAPYNFVPLSAWVHAPDWGWQVSHDLPFRDGLCGHLDLTITAETPILVGRERRRNEEPSQQQAGQAHPYQLPDGRYALPGTAIKGMVRNVVEIASFSRMAAVDDVRHGLRDISGQYVAASYTAKVRDRMQTGFMRLGLDGLPRITPCSMVRLDHRALEAWLRVEEPIFPAVRAVKKKYEAWKEICARAKLDPRALHFTPLAWEATDLGQGTEVGVPVFTGQISDSTKRDGKRRDFVFYDERPADAFSPTHREWCDFLFVHGDQATRDAEGMSWPGYWKGPYWKGDAVPVFYLRDGDKMRIGLAYMPRLAGDFSVHQMRDHTSREHGRGGGGGAPDFAETLFGKVGERSDACLRGRVTFHHAAATERCTPQATDATILNGPKASYFPNYLQQPAGPDGRLRGGKGYATCLATSDNPKPELRGWKRYPARPTGDAKVQDLTDEQKPNKKVQVILNPLPKGTRFTTRVHFHNLRIEELGALCWALTWGGAEGLRHGLGMGKSFGFGQVTIAITGADLRPNRSGAPKTTWEDARDTFVEYMDRRHAEVHKGATWRTSLQLKALLGMADPTKAGQFKGALRHMRLEPKNKVNEFLKAKQSALVLLSYVEGDHPRTHTEVAAEQKAAEDRLREEVAAREEAERLRIIEAQAIAEREAAERAEAERRQADWDAKSAEERLIIETQQEVERFLSLDENQRRAQREALLGHLNRLAKEAVGWSRAEDRTQAADLLDATYSNPKVGWTDSGLKKQKREKQEQKRRRIVAEVRAGATGANPGTADD